MINSNETIEVDYNKLIPRILMRNELFEQSTVKEVLAILKNGYIVAKELKVYATIYRAMKLTAGTYSRVEIENLVKNGYVQSNDQNKVWIPDVLFYNFIRASQKSLVEKEVIPALKPDRRNYDTLTAQQSEQLFIVFDDFLKSLSPETRQQMLKTPSDLTKSEN